MKWRRVLLCSVFLFSPLLVSHGQELVQDKQEIMKARVLEVLSQETRKVPGTDTTSIYQSIKAEIIDGTEKGKTLTLDNDYQELKAGQVFYLKHTTGTLDGTDYYNISDPYRLPVLLALLVLLVAVVIIFGRSQGARGLLALALSLFFITSLLLPGILGNHSPILVSGGVALLIIVVGSYITHGWNRVTTSAVVGMMVTIVITGALAYLSVHAAHLSGFASEEAVYLNFNTSGHIDFVGLLLGAIMIGLLGVLYDAAIGQSVAVDELSQTGQHLSQGEIKQRAARIGREHIGALVNTLAIAYVGSALPLLLLLLSSGSTNLAYTLNSEMFATEIIRAIVSSVGLVLAVPITTAISMRLIYRHLRTKSPPTRA